jgi:hypothetical protein
MNKLLSLLVLIANLSLAMAVDVPGKAISSAPSVAPSKVCLAANAPCKNSAECCAAFKCFPVKGKPVRNLRELAKIKTSKPKKTQKPKKAQDDPVRNLTELAKTVKTQKPKRTKKPKKTQKPKHSTKKYCVAKSTNNGNGGSN